MTALKCTLMSPEHTIDERLWKHDLDLIWFCNAINLFLIIGYFILSQFIENAIPRFCVEGVPKFLDFGYWLWQTDKKKKNKTKTKQKQKTNKNKNPE